MIFTEEGSKSIIISSSGSLLTIAVNNFAGTTNENSSLPCTLIMDSIVILVSVAVSFMKPFDTSTRIPSRILEVDLAGTE